VTELWNQAVHTDGEVTANRRDIIIKYKKEKTRMLTDVAMPADRKVTQKKAEKKLKYNGFCIQVTRMWTMQCVIIPIVTGATGMVTRGLMINLEAIPGKQ
jgi:hypothetical protein